MSKVFVYERVSTDKQELTQQRNNIDSYLKMKGMTCDKIVSDEGVSGGVSYKDRKLYELINEMKEGDVLVCAEISRLGRSMSDLNKLVNDELKPRKLRLIIVSMNLDLDCSNLKAIDEMILFAFGFSAQIEKEMIQERTKNALDARKKQIAEQGYFISSNGKRIEKLGGKGFSNKAIANSAAIRRNRAMNNENNKLFFEFMQDYQTIHGRVTSDTDFTPIANELNKRGKKTATGLDFNPNRARAMYNKITELYNLL